MLRKIKNILGIEGVKVDLSLNEPLIEGVLEGHCLLTAPSAFHISSVHFTFEEVYQRGRRKDKKIDTYLLLERTMALDIHVESEVPIQVPFDFEYDILESSLDHFSKTNIFTKGLTWIAKNIKGASSKYVLTVEVEVDGTKLSPFDRIEIDF